jgi:short-subunit dehydrogenase
MLNTKNILIIGASHGLGFSLVQGLLPKVQKIFTVSRTKLNLKNLTKLKKTQELENSKIVEIHCDLSETQNLPTIYKTIGKTPLDLIIYNAGIWENVDFADETDEMLEKIITVNLTSAILILKNLLPNLKRSKKANVVLIGSTAGLENSGSLGVSYVSSKFGLRGLAHSLRENLRKEKIAVTILNLGGMATDFADEIDKVLVKYGNSRIPMQDILQTINWIVNLSEASCPKEVDLPNILDETV